MMQRFHRWLLCVAAIARAATAISDDRLFLPWTDATDSPMLLHASNPQAIHSPACERTGGAQSDCVYPIAVTLSNCFDASARVAIETWVGHLQTLTADEVYLVDGQQCALLWETIKCYRNPSYTSTNDGAASNADIYKVYYGTTSPSYDTATPHEASEVLDTLKLQGRLLAPLVPEKRIVAVLTSAASASFVSAVAHDRGVAHVSTLTIGNGTTLDDLYDVDLIALWRFPHLDTWFFCSSRLLHGRPTFYLDANRTRQCLCRCPLGYDMVQRAAGPVCEEVVETTTGTCVHSNRTYVYEIASSSADRDDHNQCHIEHIPSMHQTPYPVQPSFTVDFSIYGDGDVITARSAPWTASPASRGALLDGIAWTAPGAYVIQVSTSNSTCEACLVITDMFRPQSTQMCPKPLCDELVASFCGLMQPGLAEYTPANVVAVQELVDAHYAYGEDAENDGCSAERCDATSFARREFFAVNYTLIDFARGRSCFHDPLPNAIQAQLQESPFGADGGKLQLHVPVPPGLCTRCCQYNTQLRELYVPFSDCGPAPEPICVGNDAGCSTHQCLQGTGATFFLASATVAPAYAAATVRLLRTLYYDMGYDEKTQVHIQLDCFVIGATDEKCAHSTTLAALLELSSGVTDHSLFHQASASYVFWRFRLDRGAWRDAVATAPLWFGASVTTVEVQAWSQCGIVLETTLDVVLHPREPVCVAEAFDTMWYQTSAQDSGDGALCTVPGAAFAELTFDYDPSMGLACRGNDSVIPWALSRVTCQAQYLNATVASSPLVNATGAVVRRFAVFLDPTTAVTEVGITCAFAYTSVSYRATHTVNVTKTVTITPCVGTDNTFVSPSAQVCQGVMVDRQGPDSRVRYVSQSCPEETTCRPLLALPIDDYDESPQFDSTQDVFHCQAPSTMLLLRWRPQAALGYIMSGACCLLLLASGVIYYGQPRRPLNDDYRLVWDP
ncbi:hypothetical protein ACHHYP_04647 [Achlya hypogyna]|uniref:Secreted protein n=1 Tax=Achlya hypogyna TaxID=1202772 RepID=A0A1V9ZP49_ACHHY|nr:hypothetical protein ACHHYP_04647 [Achlya hypogyna]